jgi:fructose-1,6-bisphosphatase/inositol monophosphatase family enzyme
MDPFAGEIFSATKGGGAFVNFSPAKVRVYGLGFKV